MKKLTLVVSLASLMLAFPVSADQMDELAKSKQCFDCHQIAKDTIAPSFMTIAKKYKGVKNADVILADKIEKGGVGHFGNTPMPSSGARVNVTSAEAKSLAAWVLNTK